MNIINEQTFELEVIKTNGLVLVDMFAEWCHPCKAISPILESLQKELGDKLKIVKVDMDESPNIADKYKIQSIPTLLFFKDGSEIERVVGVVSKDKLKTIIEKY